jgi:hypothetical protein
MLAVVLFLIAVVLALRLNNARQYDEVSATGFKQMLDQRVWSEPDPVLGALRSAEAQRNIVLEFRARNSQKAMELNTALVLEVAALASLTAGVISVLLVG